MQHAMFKKLMSCGGSLFFGYWPVGAASNAPLLRDRLGFHAFHTVLSRKAPSYVELLKHLTFELSLAHHRRSRKRFRALVKEGLVSMAQISF